MKTAITVLFFVFSTFTIFSSEEKVPNEWNGLILEYEKVWGPNSSSGWEKSQNNFELDPAAKKFIPRVPCKEQLSERKVSYYSLNCLVCLSYNQCLKARKLGVKCFCPLFYNRPHEPHIPFLPCKHIKNMDNNPR